VKSVAVGKAAAFEILSVDPAQKRIEGQVKGIERMVDDEKYCIDILTQISAMTKALHAVSIGLLEEHMNHCVVDAARAGDDEAREKVTEAVDAIARLVRS